MKKTVAVMQPYFMPYAGYFRLMAHADIFIMLDCVQFPRRGYVHRNVLHNINDERKWLTLPMEKGPQSIRIQDLKFLPDADELIKERMRPFPCLEDKDIDDLLMPTTEEVTPYIIDQLVFLCEQYKFAPQEIIRSSDCDIDHSLVAQEKILEIVNHVGGTDYINLPGGRELYNEDEFKARGISLKFLSPYEGNMVSILERYCLEPLDTVRDEILSVTPC